jgi:thiol-disulfide isomerase/thioredoxin
MWTGYNCPMPELNRSAPDFELCGLDGRSCRGDAHRGRIVIVNFWSADCPHVERTDASLLAALKRWGAEVILLTIASNGNESPSVLEEAARSRGLPTVLIDAGHIVADAYAAQVTPEVFVVDRAGVLRYRGAVDDTSFRQRVPTRFYLEEAVDALLSDRLPSITEFPAFGCSIIRET